MTLTDWLCAWAGASTLLGLTAGTWIDRLQRRTTPMTDQTTTLGQVACTACGWTMTYAATSRQAEAQAQSAAASHGRACPRGAAGKLERERQRLTDLRVTLQEETVAMLAEAVNVKRAALDAAARSHARAVQELDRLRAARAAGGDL